MKKTIYNEFHFKFCKNWSFTSHSIPWSIKNTSIRILDYRIKQLNIGLVDEEFTKKWIEQ